MVRKKRKVARKVKVCRDPWFRKRAGNVEEGWGFVPLNWKGFVALFLLVGVNVFAANYFNLNELALDSWLKMGVVFLLSFFVFIEFARRKSVGVKR